MANEELQRRSRRVRIFWIAAAVIAAAAIGMSMIPDPVEVDIAKIDRGDVRVEVVDEGRTRMHDVYILSAPVTGRVLRVEVEPGDEVAAVLGLGHVAGYEHGPSAGVLDQPCGVLGVGVLVQIGDEDVGAFASVGDGHGPTDPAVSTP